VCAPPFRRHAARRGFGACPSGCRADRSPLRCAARIRQAGRRRPRRRLGSGLR